MLLVATTLGLTEQAYATGFDLQEALRQLN